MIYSKQDMRRFGDAVVKEADSVLFQLMCNLTAQLAINPAGASEHMAQMLANFTNQLTERREKLEETL